jgi:hypothetical protein
VYSAQRFKTATAGYPPSLAMYTLRSAAVFDDPYYLGIRGLGEFQTLVDRRHYRRNLFAGLERAPEVAAHEALLVWDAPEPRDGAGIAFDWLQAVAIDRSTPYRGIAVLDAARTRGLPDAIARYLPATSVLRKRGGGAP